MVTAEREAAKRDTTDARSISQRRDAAYSKECREKYLLKRSLEARIENERDLTREKAATFKGAHWTGQRLQEQAKGHDTHAGSEKQRKNSIANKEAKTLRAQMERPVKEVEWERDVAKKLHTMLKRLYRSCRLQILRIKIASKCDTVIEVMARSNIG
jgi:hypothetical protein